MILRVIYGIWYLPLFLILTILAGIIGLIGSKFSRNFVRVISSQIWGAIVLGPAFINIKVTGQKNLPPTGGFILLVNHRSLLDIPATCLAVERPISWVAKSSLGKIPIFGSVLKAAHILVDRKGGVESAKKMLTDAATL
ncbi:MAG: 1-acyl-sn-glycerol-3-phosphate acyltransferase, partial [Deltaproteobacteria bacterium]|nr:1-acyl-sn-glycerol-3-phosphate acyltransferase [Deltaproteobacteria bacterium]